MTQKKQNENSQQQTRGKILRVKIFRGENFENILILKIRIWSYYYNPDDRAFSDMNRNYDISRNKQ